VEWFRYQLFLMQYCHPLFLLVPSKFCRIPIPENISIIRRTLFFTAQSMNVATELPGPPSQGISRAMSSCLLAPITAERLGFRSCPHSWATRGRRALSCTREVNIISLVRNKRTYRTLILLCNHIHSKQTNKYQQQNLRK
jgi:hypothetical protein